MRHPTDGTLRRLVDEPDGVADADREHVADCPVCLSGLAAVQEDAAMAEAVLDVEFNVDVDAGWSRLSDAITADERSHRPATTGVARRWRVRLRSPMAAVLGVAVILTGAGAAAAADWLEIFRTERIAPITVDQSDLVGLPDLAAFGTLDITDPVDLREVADAAAAEKATGLGVPRVAELPRGVTGNPRFQVGGRVAAVFTFSVAKATKTAAATGQKPPPPPGLDGSQFRLTAGPGLAAVWQGSQNAPAMFVARVVAPTAYSSRVPFATARDYLLSLSGLPEDVASQLRRFTNAGTTLPIPVHSGELKSSAAEVGGAPATVLTTKDGTLAGVVWVKDGVVTAVAGSLSADEVLEVARGLRWDR